MRPILPLTLAGLLWAAPHPAVAAPAADDVEILLTRPTGMDEDAWRVARREAARRLGSSRSPKAADALIQVVETERYDAVLSIAMKSLAKIGDPRAIDALQKVYADRSVDNFVRQDAAEAIRALGGTPKDDARLLGEADAGPVGGGGGVSGPQLGVMGEASVAGDDFEAGEGIRPLPSTVRARDRELAFVLGNLDLSANIGLRRPPGGAQTGDPVLADAGLGVVSAYVDERERWGWTAQGVLWGSLRNGDVTATPAPDGSDDGNTLYFGQSLAGSASIHAYFGATDFHAFGTLGLSERLSMIRVQDVQDTGVDESALSDTRFGMDVIPAAGLGWGRHLNRGAALRVDAIVAALEAENILTRPLDAPTRRALQEATYRQANRLSTYPRLAAVIGILTRGGFLARRPGPRLVHRLRSILDDPSYLERMGGIRVRTGFLFGAAIAQKDRFLREGDNNGAPFLQFLAGFPLSRERQIDADLRFWYDVIGPLRGFTTDLGARYTRFLHTKYDDYAGQWHLGLRGGVSRRDLDLDQDGSPDDTGMGYRAVGEAGYTFAFRRGSAVALAADVGVDSGRLLLGINLSFQIGVMRSSVYGGSSGAAPGKKARRGKSRGKAGAAAGAKGKASVGAKGGATPGKK